MNPDGWYATADEAVANASSTIVSIDGFVIYSDGIDDERHASTSPAETER